MALPVFGKAHQAQAGTDFTWFVYGSSLDTAAFAEWAGSHGYAPPRLAGAPRVRLHGWRLAFDVLSRHWGGAVASLAEAPGDWVEGLAVALPGAARGMVEHKEGAVSGLYTAFPVSLIPVEGGPAIEAVAFRGAAGRRLPSDAPPSPGYLEALRRGAREQGLSAEWLGRLDALAG